MYKKETLLRKKRFMNLSELPQIISNARHNNQSEYGLIRVDIRDNVALIWVIYWTCLGNTSHLPLAAKQTLAKVDSFIQRAMENKDIVIKVSDCESNWHYFVYTSIDDNMYGVLEVGNGQYELKDLSTGKSLGNGAIFSRPYNAIEYLGA